jgi:type I site-specific restriction-modification system R (restriction) subunit
MMTTKKRLPGSVIVQQTAIQQATSLLEQLPEKPKEIWTLKEAIDLLQDSISTALKRGYNYEEVAAMLADQGIQISISSLKRYLASTKKEKAVAEVVKPRRPRRTAAQKQAEAEAKLSATPAPVSTPNEPPVQQEAADSTPAKRTTGRPTSTRPKTATQATSGRPRKKKA